MDIVLGVSMAPTSVRMLLVEGENANGVTVEDNQFSFAAADDAATLSAADQVISAILGTREGATEAGHALTSTGVTWTDPVDAAALRDALATRKVENVMLVSSFMAAAALAQTVGCTVGDAHTALLFLEPDTATLAVIDSADGSISDVHKELMSGGHSVAELAEMVAGLEALETRPQSVFIVGSGVDVAAIKPQLEAVTTHSGHRGRRARDRAGVGRRTGVCKRSAFCVVDGGAGLRARSWHRRDRPLRRVAGIPCGTAMFRLVPRWVKTISPTALSRMRTPMPTPLIRMW